MELEQLLKYFARIVTMLLVLPLHEAAHAYTAKLFGDDTAERQGRLTINPFSHIDPIGGLLMVVTGFGWAKPVPVNPLRFKKYRAGIAITALAGPVSNILAAFAAGLINAAIRCTESGRDALLEYYISRDISPLYCTLLLTEFLMMVNIGLAIFNLIPIPPLDGFNVLRYFTSEKVDRWFFTHQREISFGFLIFILALNSGIIPDKYNLLFIAENKIFNGMWDLLMKIPESKWS